MTVRRRLKFVEDGNNDTDGASHKSDSEVKCATFEGVNATLIPIDAIENLNCIVRLSKLDDVLPQTSYPLLGNSRDNALFKSADITGRYLYFVIFLSYP